MTKSIELEKEMITDAVFRKMELAYHQFMHADVKELTRTSGEVGTLRHITVVSFDFLLRELNLVGFHKLAI